MYSTDWVEKLYRGFARNLTQPFDFVCFTDQLRDYKEPIRQALLSSSVPTYADCLQPYAMNAPMILVGLDTVVTGNVDELADYAMTRDIPAYPRDPYNAQQVCNGVGLVPNGYDWVWSGFDGNKRPQADMERIRQTRHNILDDIFPGQVVSYKGEVKKNGLGDARIVYFHGQEKPHELDDDWLMESWQ